MLALLFPGQSAQDPETLRDLLGHPVFDTLRAVTGIDAARLAPDAMYENAIAQPLVCAIELAAAATLDLPVQLLAGYSIGELAAYGIAGALEVGDVLRLAQIRARAMDAACSDPQAMIALRGTAPVLPRGVFPAIRNGPDRLVAAGHAAAVGTLDGTILPVRVASHTPLMAPAVPVFRTALEASDFRAPRLRMLAGIDGQPVLTRARAIDTLARQLAETVDWAACMEGLRENGCTSALELPPGANLARMLRETDIPARAMAEFRSPRGAADWARARI